jgi:SAM-dependent methyltransferase
VDLKLLFQKLVQRLRAYGFRGVLRSAFRYLRSGAKEDSVDTKYGTDTSGLVPLWKFQIASRNARYGSHYEPSDEEDFQTTIGAVKQDFGAFTFVDLGCGKGRALILASKSGFKRIVGVEFVGELRSIAQANVAKMGIGNAAVLHADAAEFRFPEGDLVVYLFNPFTEEVMRKVVENLRGRGSSELYIIYNNPRHASLFDASGFLTRSACPPTARYPTVIWRSNKDARAASTVNK